MTLDVDGNVRELPYASQVLAGCRSNSDRRVVASWRGPGGADQAGSKLGRSRPVSDRQDDPSDEMGGEGA